MSDFKAKMQKIRLLLGPDARPSWGAYSAPPHPLAVFKHLRPPTSKGRAQEDGREGNTEGSGKEDEGEVRGGEGREREGPVPQIFWPRTTRGSRQTVKPSSPIQIAYTAS